MKVLSAYGKELAARVSAEEALERFTRLCLRRTAGGLPPSAQMANGLRKLARGAGQDADRAEQDYLTELLSLPAAARHRRLVEGPPGRTGGARRAGTAGARHPAGHAPRQCGRGHARDVARGP